MFTEQAEVIGGGAMKGNKVFAVDLQGLSSVREMHERIKGGMRFPDYYGENWYAFWDCATDLLGEEMVIEFIGIEWLQRRYPAEWNVLFAYLKDLKHYDDDRYADITRIVLVTGDVRTEIR